jgi:hypothetical protein
MESIIESLAGSLIVVAIAAALVTKRLLLAGTRRLVKHSIPPTLIGEHPRN